MFFKPNRIKTSMNNKINLEGIKKIYVLFMMLF